MPGQIRQIKIALDTHDKVMKVPESLQQRNDKEPSEKRVKEWFVDSSMSQ